jgi:hypothetical protein
MRWQGSGVRAVAIPLGDPFRYKARPITIGRNQGDVSFILAQNPPCLPVSESVTATPMLDAVALEPGDGVRHDAAMIQKYQSAAAPLGLPDNDVEEVFSDRFSSADHGDAVTFFVFAATVNRRAKFFDRERTVGIIFEDGVDGALNPARPLAH